MGTRIITLNNSEFSAATSTTRLLEYYASKENVRQAIYYSQQIHPAVNSNTAGILSNDESAAIQDLRLNADLGSKKSVSVSVLFSKGKESSNFQIVCAGVLVSEVNKRRAAQSQQNIELAESKYEIKSLEPFYLSEYLYMTPSAMSSLQILHCDLHPNSQTWHTNSGTANKKEGLSVYGMFHSLVCTSQGAIKLRKMFLRPSTNISTIAANQQSIATLIQPNNSEVLSQLASTLRKIHNMESIISKLSKGIDSTCVGHSSRGGLWGAVEQFSSNVVEVQRLAGLFSGWELSTHLKKVY